MRMLNLFDHVQYSLNKSRWFISIILALVLALLFSVIFFRYQVDSNLKILRALNSYISSLASSNDRPELMRVLKSISSKSNSELVLIENEIVLATSKNLSDLDRQYVKPIQYLKIFDAEMMGLKYSVSESIQSLRFEKSNLQLIMINDLSSILWASLFIFLGTLFLSLLSSLYLSHRTQKVLKKSLEPLKGLQLDIKALVDGENNISELQNISEFEEIRQTVTQTKIKLDNANDKLAEVKAKKISAEAYKCLIHDLHNPVAALRQLAVLSQDSKLDEETRNEAIQSISRISHQILNQVTAAKKNLEDGVVSLQELDLRECIKESIGQIRAINSSKDILLDLTSDKVMVPHDPVALKRALINLVENGLEAAMSKIEVSLKESNGFVSILVNDDGLGMDESLVPLYFQGRGQSGKANRQAFGLSSANHIVKSHGGKLIYRKLPINGSSFEIRLGAL